VTAFEIAYRCAEPFLPPLYGTVRRKLLALTRGNGRAQPSILDVGGRKSHYTIGVPGLVTVAELPRITPTQISLNLGITEAMQEDIKARRSNISAIVLDDMTESKLVSESFDYVVAVEVLEHVERDRDFLRNVHRVLRPGGMFLMTTPNGDSNPVPYNSDHKRHYTRVSLVASLEEFFEDTCVEYAIVGGLARSLGLRPWSVKRPLKTLASMGGNLANAALSGRPRVRTSALGTKHLVATARRAR
jgi:SAM-dependent methyltransferase